MKIVIVGAGLAGLTCAKVLRERGAEVAVFEAPDGVGGRVRTDEKDGFLLDRGFQVYFTSHPGADFRPLALRRIPYGQFAQPPGIHSRPPDNRTQTPGFVLAGEYTEDSSINGSMLSGEKAAGAVME
jgi:phytoene dehydrogenase-like protein